MMYIHVSVSVRHTSPCQNTKTKNKVHFIIDIPFNCLDYSIRDERGAFRHTMSLHHFWFKQLKFN